jgi:hypothetical protein
MAARKPAHDQTLRPHRGRNHVRWGRVDRDLSFQFCWWIKSKTRLSTDAPVPSASRADMVEGLYMKLSTCCVVVAITSSTMTFPPQRADAQSMCETARQRFPNQIKIWCKDSNVDEVPFEMDNPQIKDYPSAELPDQPATPQPTPTPEPVHTKTGAPTPGCKISGLWPYAGNCLMDEIGHTIDKVFPPRKDSDGDPFPAN